MKPIGLRREAASALQGSLQMQGQGQRQGQIDLWLPLKLYPSIDRRRFTVVMPESIIELEEGEFSKGTCHYLSTGALSGPYDLPYAVGDKLYVREAFALVPVTAYRCSTGVQQKTSPGDPDMAAIYAAGWERSSPAWLPWSRMPKWAARTTLIVRSVSLAPWEELREGRIPARPTKGLENGQWAIAIWCDIAQDAECPLPVAA